MPIKVNQTLRLYPFYRLLIQSKIDDFKPYGEHLSTEEFYTSDFDLSSFDANKFGIGFTFSPLFGLAKFKLRGQAVTLKSLSLRYAHYDRSDGLSADAITMALQFKMKR